MERFKKIKDINVLVYGDLMVDKYICGQVSRISPEAPVPVLQVESRLSKLGGAGNVINNIISLGASVRVLGGIGKDYEGESIIEEFKKKGIDTRHIRQYLEIQTISKTRLISRNHQLLRYDEEEIRDMPQEYMKYLEQNKKFIFEDIHVVVISDYGKGAVTMELAQFLITAAIDLGIPVVVDPKGKDYNKYKGASVCTPNVKELGDVIGKILKTEEDEEIAGKQIRECVQLSNLLLTRSEKGILLFDSMNNKKDFPAVSKDVVDVTGAGDTVVSVVALMMVVGFSMEECCEIANIAASIVCSKFGAATLSLNELIGEILDIGSFKNINVKTAKYILTNLKENGKRIVFTNGCFDMLHAGHLASFVQAKAYGDILVVAVNSDESVKRLKGENRPIINESDRIAMLCALECVDYVILMEEDTPIKMIQELRPDVTVKGNDWAQKYLPEKQVVESYGGCVQFVDLCGESSTTNIIRKIRND